MLFDTFLYMCPESGLRIMNYYICFLHNELNYLIGTSPKRLVIDQIFKR